MSTITPETTVLTTTNWHPHYRRSEELGEEITELCGYIYAATYRLLEMIREFDAEGLWQVDGIGSCAHWLNWKCGIGMNAAREKVRIANALADLPNTSATFARGEISYSKVRAMTRVATPENEDYLLMIAKHGTGHHMETLVRKYRRTKRLQEMDDCRKQHDERELHVYYEPDGSMVFHARMPAEKGALLLKAIELAADQAEKDVSAETLTNNEGDLSHLEDGPHVSAETSRRLCCDAGISVLSEDENGDTLNIGRKTRIIPPAMRRALRARDEGCRFPGCTHKHYIDGHHIQHWSQGGETRLANLVQLCRRHHRLVHEGGFDCRKNEQGLIEFRNPEGKLIPRTGELPRISPSLDLTERMRNRYEDLFIDANTCVTHYDGSPMDWNLAVGALFQ